MWFKKSSAHSRGQGAEGSHVQPGPVGPTAERPRELARRACSLLGARKEAEAVACFLAACRRDPSLFRELGGEFAGTAGALGGVSRLEFQIAAVRAALAAEEEDVREMYSELFEEYAEEPAATARLRELGAEIDAAVVTGRLPRALVRRGAWRR